MPSSQKKLFLKNLSDQSCERYRHFLAFKYLILPIYSIVSEEEMRKFVYRTNTNTFSCFLFFLF